MTQQLQSEMSKMMTLSYSEISCGIWKLGIILGNVQLYLGRERKIYNASYSIFA